jgi:hypothetical protein
VRKLSGLDLISDSNCLRFAPLGRNNPPIGLPLLRQQFGRPQNVTLKVRFTQSARLRSANCSLEIAGPSESPGSPQRGFHIRRFGGDGPAAP